MFLPKDLEPLEQTSRLKIMALLYRRGDVNTRDALDSLKMTAGNLDSHARRLQAIGWLDARKSLTSNGFCHRLRITGKGQKEFRRYLGIVKEFLESTLDD